MAPPEQLITPDVEAVGRLSAVPAMLRIVCEETGMGVAAVARVDDETWTACAVLDRINFGLARRGHPDLNATLCGEARGLRAPVACDHAAEHPVYGQHPMLRTHGIQSCISVPIIKSDGHCFGTLCAIDPLPREVSSLKTLALFQGFADLIAHLLEDEERRIKTRPALIDTATTAELREQFMAVLGHELRNPLAGLSAAGEIVARRSSEPEVLRAAERIRSITRRMSDLISDVMDFARGRVEGEWNCAFDPVGDLGDAFRDVIAELRLAHPEVAFDEELRVHGVVHCSRGRLQQLLSNLLGNAVTHGTPSKPIDVSAWTEDEWLVLTVRNWGAPIPAQNLTQIFQPYWRPPESRERAGLGLGLHICAMIVKAHGGQLQVSSTPEHGTRFIARLPVRPGQTLEAAHGG